MQSPTIDMHVHAFPDSLAGRAVAALEAACPWQAIGDGTVADLLASMDAAGVNVSAVFTIATRPDQVEGILRWCEAIRSARVEPFPSVHPAVASPEQWIARVAAGGFKGIKLHPMYQEFAIDEPRMDRLYRACQDAGIIIAFHCGQDIGYPPDDDRASAARVADMLPRWPGLRVICSHMGGWREWDAAEESLLGTPNVWLDTSFSLEDMGAERAVKMIRRHGAGRVIFGTDWPWRSQEDSLAFLHGLGLSAAEEQAVRGSNAAALLNSKHQGPNEEFPKCKRIPRS